MILRIDFRPKRRKRASGTEVGKHAERKTSVPNGENGLPGRKSAGKYRKTYIEYPILQTLFAKLTWNHYVELLKIDVP